MMGLRKVANTDIAARCAARPWGDTQQRRTGRCLVAAHPSNHSTFPVVTTATGRLCASAPVRQPHTPIPYTPLRRRGTAGVGPHPSADRPPCRCRPRTHCLSVHIGLERTDSHDPAPLSPPAPNLLTMGRPSWLKQWWRELMYAFSCAVLRLCVRQMPLQYSNGSPQNPLSLCRGDLRPMRQ